MRNWNKTTRTVLRWTHLLVGWLIGVFVYTPMREDDTFVLLMLGCGCGSRRASGVCTNA